jgi:hypothetical protein
MSFLNAAILQVFISEHEIARETCEKTGLVDTLSLLGHISLRIHSAANA